MSDIPKAIWKGTFDIGGVELKCFTLDNGQRVIEAESMEKLFSSMGSDDFVVDQAELERLNKWQKDI